MLTRYDCHVGKQNIENLSKTSFSKIEIGHGPPKTKIFNTIINKPSFKHVQNILKTDRQTSGI